MSTERKPTAEELFETLEDEDDAEEAARILALSDEALDRELAADGFDPAAERARGRALGAKALGAAKAARPPRRSVIVRWVALAAAALAIPATAVIVSLQPVAVTAPAPSAQKIRRKALEACDQKRWQECVQGLGDARSIDPAGDSDERVQRAWSDARRALATPDPGSPPSDDKPKPP